MHQSRLLTNKGRESASYTATILDRSRQLLSGWPVSGQPSLNGKKVDKAVQPAVPSEVPRGKSASVGVEPALERISNRDFRGGSVKLDGRHFVDCTLEACTLEYCGGPVVLEGTHFSGCQFKYGGEAAMTVSLLECFGLIEPQPGERIRCLAQGAARVH